MWKIAYIIEEEKNREYVYNYIPNAFEDEITNRIHAEMPNKKSAEDVKEVVDRHLDKRGAIYESWVYEVPDEPKEEFENPWRENGLKDIDFI